MFKTPKQLAQTSPNTVKLNPDSCEMLTKYIPISRSVTYTNKPTQFVNNFTITVPLALNVNLKTSASSQKHYFENSDPWGKWI